MVELKDLIEELKYSKALAEARIDLAREMGDADMEYLNLGYSMACCDYVERLEEILEGTE